MENVVKRNDLRAINCSPKILFSFSLIPGGAPSKSVVGYLNVVIQQFWLFLVGLLFLQIILIYILRIARGFRDKKAWIFLLYIFGNYLFSVGIADLSILYWGADSITSFTTGMKYEVFYFVIFILTSCLTRGIAEVKAVSPLKLGLALCLSYFFLHTLHFAAYIKGILAGNPYPMIPFWDFYSSRSISF